MSTGSEQMNDLIRGRVGIGQTEDVAGETVGEVSEQVGFDGGARTAAPVRTAAQWFNELVDEQTHGGPVARGRK